MHVIAVFVAALLGFSNALADTGSINTLLMEMEPFTGVTETGRLVYALEESDAEGMREMPVSIVIKRISETGVKDIMLEIGSGEDALQIGPLQALDQNPLIFAFLQRDVNAMAARTGGAAHYFMSLIRDAIVSNTSIEQVEILHEGRTYSARSAKIEPFALEPVRDQFPKLANKNYRIIVSEWIPGGIYQIQSNRSGDGGDISRVVRFAGKE